MHGHDVGVSLDDHHLPRPRDVLLGQVQAVEHLGLAVQRRLARGVDVLGLQPVVVEDPPRAETDDVPGRIADGPQQSSVEESIGPRWPFRATPALIISPTSKPLRTKCFTSESQPDGANPQPKCAAAAMSNPRAARNARAGAASSVAEFGGVELGGCLGDRDQPRPRPSFRARRGSALDQRQGDPRAVGQPLHGLDEGQVLDLHHELEEIAALAAAEAVERPARRTDLERRGLLLVERA